MNMTDLAALRARCAAQDARQDAQLHTLLSPSQRPQITAPAPNWIRAGVPVVEAERRSLLDGLYAEFGRARTAAPHQRAAKAFGGMTKLVPE